MEATKLCHRCNNRGYSKHLNDLRLLCPSGFAESNVFHLIKPEAQLEGSTPATTLSGCRCSKYHPVSDRVRAQPKQSPSQSPSPTWAESAWAESESEALQVANGNCHRANL